MSSQTTTVATPKGKASASAKLAAADQLATAERVEREARNTLHRILTDAVILTGPDGKPVENTPALVFAAAGKRAKDSPHATTANALNRAMVSWDKRGVKLAERVEKARTAADAAKGKEEDAKAPGFARLDDDSDRVPLTAATVKLLIEARKGHRGGVLIIEGDSAISLISALADAVDDIAEPGTALTYTISGKPARIRARHIDNAGKTELHLSVVVG